MCGRGVFAEAGKVTIVLAVVALRDAAVEF